ncbi:class I SAM-dependent methyltransferase [Lentisphaerota bacterium ZTH]|nr:class I SAM-dependent methyltransferase [Lentisphaerota bacterium]WET07303.1 class I SAM-dependent methyltransferase [Lentisphaerota bacterium ZTH]
MEYDKKLADRFTRFKLEFPYFKLMDAALERAVREVVANRTVLDLGCGSGHLTRMLKRWGAAEVTGVDISEPMLELAECREAEDRLGIKYLQSSIQELGRIGEFDIITGGCLLTYAANTADLSEMIRNIALNAKKGTRYFGQEHSGIYRRYEKAVLRKYNIEIEILQCCKEYLDASFTAHFSLGDIQFRNMVFERNYLSSVLEKHGFSNIKWHPLQLPENADMSGEFRGWEDIGNDSINEILDCVYTG